VSPGVSYRYAYLVVNRGGTYWYHTHGHGNTARQVYMGLAGLFIVEDEDERLLNKALGMELGETDLPLIIQDKNFDNAGNLVYDLNEMDRSMGYPGNVILVNMTPAPCLEVETRLYRLTAPFIVSAPGCGSRSERRTPSRLERSRLPMLDLSPR
jgi:FtsP/CotA-like multicopper oxidase with cupredoxin domain